MKIEHVYAWTKCFDLVSNRVKMLNHMLGGSYDGCISNPCSLRLVRGRYRVMLGDSEYASFGVYDVTSVESALGQLDYLVDGLWLIRRGGFTIS